MIRIIIALAATLAITAASARTFGLGGEGLRIGKFGAAGKQGSNGGAVGCSGVSLAFTTPCNSMYLTVVH